MTAAWLAAAALCLRLGGLGAAEEGMRERETEAVIDAVLFALLGEAAPAAEEVVCLVVRRTVDGKEQLGDPSPDHLARLREGHPNLRPGSACKRGRGQPAIEAATGGRAVVLDVGPVEWLGEDEARTGAGFSRGGWGVTESEYRLERSGDVWTVAQTTRKRIT